MIATFPDGDMWGLPTLTPYEKRGWCVAEFSIASKCDRIKNLDEPAVQAIAKMRDWPSSVKEFADVMRLSCVDDPDFNNKEGLTFDADKGVDFTSKSDRAM